MAAVGREALLRRGVMRLLEDLLAWAVLLAAALGRAARQQQQRRGGQAGPAAAPERERTGGEAEEWQELLMASLDLPAVLRASARLLSGAPEGEGSRSEGPGSEDVEDSWEGSPAEDSKRAGPAGEGLEREEECRVQLARRINWATLAMLHVLGPAARSAEARHGARAGGSDGGGGGGFRLTKDLSDLLFAVGAYVGFDGPARGPGGSRWWETLVHVWTVASPSAPRLPSEEVEVLLARAAFLVPPSRIAPAPEELSWDVKA